MKSQREAYASDLSDKEWDFIKNDVPQAKSNKRIGGRPEKYAKREIVNAIFYLISSGCRYADIPHDLPPGGIVWKYFNRWSKAGIWRNINDKMRRKVRLARKRNENPTLGLIDSQTVKSLCFGEETGYDAGKKTKGRKRHLLTDTQGLLLGLKVHSAKIQDRDGAKLLLRRARSTVKILESILADGGYAGKLIGWVKEKFGKTLEIAKRNELHTFAVLPKRWIIERTNAWISVARRLSKDYEKKTVNQESMIYVRMIQLMVRWVS